MGLLNRILGLLRDICRALTHSMGKMGMLIWGIFIENMHILEKIIRSIRSEIKKARARLKVV